MTPEEGVSRFGRAIDGAAGTVVFGGGASALVGEIFHNEGDDYIVVEGCISGHFPLDNEGVRITDTFAVPLSSILYFRWRDDRV